MSNKTYIYYVRISLDRNGIRDVIEKIDCKETEKSFVTYDRRISKDKLLKIDTNIIDNSKLISYFTYCLEGDQETALELIKTKITERLNSLKEDVNKLSNAFTKDDLSSKIEQYYEENLIGEFGNEQTERVKEILKDFVTFYL